MRVKILSLLSGIFACTFTACNFNEPAGTAGATAAEDTDRHHEKSFSWDTPAAENAAHPALAKTAARSTRFETLEDLGEAVRRLEEGLQSPGASDSLWKPLDYACDELALALWNAFGTIRIGDSVAFDETILKSRCAYVGDAEIGGLGKGSAEYPSQEVEHRVYPYKMIGRAWNNFNATVYKSTGAETQFKKNREKAFVTAWWDTDATRIGVRVYLLNCGPVGASHVCTSGASKSDWYGNDDYVSVRDYAVGVSIKVTLPASISVAPATLKVSDAVIGLHSADHAGIAFRATSSSGLLPYTTVLNLPPTQYITW